MPGKLLEFYGLREHPFGVSPNPRYLYLAAQHREALATLISGIENLVGFSALIAEPGVGKTALLFEVIRHVKDRASTALISNTQCNGSGLIRYIAMSLQIPGWESEQDPIRLYHSLTTFASERQHTKPVVIIIDEAQDLESSALETLRLLSNFEAEDRKLLHIILAGQPELGEKLRRKSLKQLFQRITVIARLGCLSPEETEKCIAFRLRTAGYTGTPLFSDDAMAMIKQASHGVPREINRICINALEAGFALRKHEIGAEVIEQVLSDLDLSCGSSAEDSSRAAPFETRPWAQRAEIAAPAKRSEMSTDSWVVDPSVDVSLGDEVIQSVLSGMVLTGDPQTDTLKLETEHFPTAPQVELDALDTSDKPRISYAHSGLGPSDEEIRALMSEMDQSLGTRIRASKGAGGVEPQVAGVEPNVLSAPLKPKIPATADPRVLKIFAPRNPSELPVKKVDPKIFETPPEPVAFRIREDAWVTGVPIDPWARTGALTPHSSEIQKTQEPPENVENPSDGKSRKKIHPFVIFLCVVVALIVILYWALPYISK